MQHHPHSERSFLHFSFLKEIKVHGIYYNAFSRYLNQYPYLRKEHYHDFYTVLLFTGGSGVFRLNTNSYKVGPQTICLIAPNQSHSFEGIDEMEGTVFFFCQDFYVEEFSFIRLLNIFSCTSHLAGNRCNPCNDLTESEFSQVQGVLWTIHQEYENYTPLNNSKIIIRSFLNILLLRLSEIYNSKSDDHNEGDSIIINELSHLIDSYFIREHHIGFYSSAFNVSEKHLNDICNKHFNCGLKKILTDRLMQEARKLLLSTELSVSEISFKMNFEDNSYFTKVFKKQTGITPKRFRDIHKKIVP